MERIGLNGTRESNDIAARLRVERWLNFVRIVVFVIVFVVVFIFVCVVVRGCLCCTIHVAMRCVYLAASQPA